MIAFHLSRSYGEVPLSVNLAQEGKCYFVRIERIYFPPKFVLFILFSVMRQCGRVVFLGVLCLLK
jgi:hypothetical protein